MGVQALACITRHSRGVWGLAPNQLPTHAACTARAALVAKGAWVFPCARFGVNTPAKAVVHPFAVCSWCWRRPRWPILRHCCLLLRWSRLKLPRSALILPRRAHLCTLAWPGLLLSCCGCGCARARWRGLAPACLATSCSALRPTNYRVRGLRGVGEFRN
jgi:hypothetical protein